MVSTEVVTLTGTTTGPARPAEPAGTEQDYDVVVVGGGVAGLSAALQLARARRSVLVVDAGQPRNATAEHSHGFLTRDGAAPAELVEAGRTEVAGYGGRLLDGRVVSAAREPDGGFTVALDEGTSARARRVLLTTGVVDELPDVPGVAERWGRDVLHCPYCHGWEVRDQAIGVLATGPVAVHQALLFRQWTADVTLLRHAGPAPDPADLERLAARGVPVVDGEVAALVVEDDHLTGVRLATGTVIPLSAVVVGPRTSVPHGVVASLGLQVSDHPMGVGHFIAADPTGLTSVPGVWVAGNVADLGAQLLQAAASGARAAAMINADLVTEDTDRAVVAQRRSASAGVRV